MSSSNKEPAYSFIRAKEFADLCEGWLTSRESKILYECASKLKKGDVVEIGSWQGKSTIYIAYGLLSSSVKTNFYAVDPHTGSAEHQDAGKKVWTFDNFTRNIEKAGIKDAVTPKVMLSEQFAKEYMSEVGFVFIDGAHDYESVKKDVDSWLPKMIDGGYVAFHDSYTGSDVYKVLRREIYRSRNAGIIRTADSITYFRYERKNSLFVYFINLTKLCARDLVNLLHKNKIMHNLIMKMKK